MANLSIRMEVRRFTRLTLRFGKKSDDHKHAAAPDFVHYNFCRAQVVGQIEISR